MLRNSRIDKRGTIMNTKAITEYLDTLKDRGIPSVDCMIHKNHELVYRHFNGETDANATRPMNGNEQYIVFSMTKLQTMTAVLKLVEDGVLSLEDEVGEYLPAYKKLFVKEEDGTVVPCQTPLKLWHLVSMQSGLDYDLDRPGIRRVLAEKGQAATTREIVDSFVETPILFTPGTAFNYSLSHDVVAAVIEVASGMSFGEYLKKTIWEPIGMQHTFFAKPLNEEVPNLVTEFITNEQGKTVPMEPSCNYQLSECYESGGAGLISCAEDYALLGDMLACGGVAKNGIRILKPETVELMKTNLLCEKSMELIARNMGRTGYGYGCGVQVLLHPEMIGSPAPAGVFGWDGAAGSILIMDTASKTSLVYMMHVRNCGLAFGEVHQKLRDLLFSEETL